MLDSFSASKRLVIPNVRVAGCQAVVPSQIISNDTLLSMAPDDKSREELLRACTMSGLNTRYHAAAGVTMSDMCLEAAKTLLQNINWQPSSLDALIVVTVTPDELIPPPGYRLHAKLGLSKGCLVLDTLMGCAGYTHGLFLAASLLEQGRFSRVLLVAGETLSRTVAPNDLKSLALLGDAGSATALEYAPGASPLYMVMGADGANADCIRQPGKGYRASDSPPYFQMNGVKVFTFSQGVVPKVLRATLELAGLEQEKIDYFCLHQANQMILDAVAKQANLPAAKVINTISRFGNCGSASIPLALCAERERLSAHASCQVLQVGFGVGLAWSSVLLRLSAEHIGGIRFMPIS